MAFVTLYSYNPNSTTTRTVFYDSENPSYISYTDRAGGGTTPMPPTSAVLSVICAPGTFDQYTYYSEANAPYGTFTVLHNALECGYVKPTCDIQKVSFLKTDETSSGASNGTANLFCSSSFPPITYYLKRASVQGPIASNQTGYFTGLVPASDYHIDAIDNNGCAYTQYFAIAAFDNTKTHYKYRLRFKSMTGDTQFELQLYDMRNAYDATQYPVDIEGTDNPVIYKQADPSEDKTTPIVSSSLTMNLWYTGADFTPQELMNTPEQSWFVVLLQQGVPYFQGWVLPDEIMAEYMDAPYAVTVTATDGLPSLKGNLFGDGSGGQGYGSYQIQQYGLAQWCRLVKQCLDQLGYNYGSVIVLSSLQFNGVYDRNLWLNLGTWSDILYDASGAAIDTYSALSLLLQGMNLTLISANGRFVLVNWNDLFYMNNAVVDALFQNAIYEFAGDFSSIDATGSAVAQPYFQPIGFLFPIRPIRPPNHLTNDKPYNIELDVNFSLLALLFENPSFEIGAVQGQLPSGMAEIGTTTGWAFCNHDPVSPTNAQVGAADGSWELRFQWPYVQGTAGATAQLTNYIQLAQAAQVDQPNMLVQVSFQWRPKAAPTLGSVNTLPNFGICFRDGSSSNWYSWAPNRNPPAWVPFSTDTNVVMISSNLNTGGDFITWQTLQVQTAQLPETGIGILQIRLFPPGYDKNVDVPAGALVVCDIDVLNITLANAVQSFVNQTGERHTMAAVTGIPTANLKQNECKLFTYPLNKRVAGNVFYGHDYATAQVGNLWNYALKPADPQGRLAATVIRAIARNYALPMLKFEGTVSAELLYYYGLFSLKYYNGVLFMPLSIEGDLRLSTWKVALLQINDTDVQDVYAYLPTYEKNARRNG